MSKFLNLIDKIYSSNKSYEKMDLSNNILDNLFSELEKSHPDLYNKTIFEFEKLAYEIPMDKAKEIVKAMKPYGPKWSYEQIKDFIYAKGISDKCIEYYLVMNMMYNDYHSVAKMVQKEEDADFYFEMSKNFIMDTDAKPFKVSKYFLNI